MKPTASLLSRSLAALAAALCLAGAACWSSGCVAVVAAGAGAGAVAYIRGELDSTLNANVDRAAKAVAKAVEQLQFAKVSENKDAMLAIFIVRNAADKRIEVRLERAGEGLTKVKIRVGVFGDESLSLAILEKIKANL